MNIPIFIKYLFLLLTLASTNGIANTKSLDLAVMSLNVYGWKTMPQHSADYADIIKKYKIDVVGIQEGVDDWQLKSHQPTDYSRSTALKESLGECWQHIFQIFINQCSGIKFVDSGRFDLTDGPNATRTGEFAIISKADNKYLLVNIHWDHESQVTRIANANETAELINKNNQYPTILLGDFNSSCFGDEVSIVQSKTKMSLFANAGIDCLLIKGLSGHSKTINAYPSDHPAIIATLKPKA
ncbi:MAG: endonuclease/exonuclease/phosphatase family protein [Colwelliaceae bacterium]|nr:endonuclease/exonuclease/phosphatase family protein [Colwelliaceae bacterium]